MRETIHGLTSNPIVLCALAGVLTALKVDFSAFRAFKSWEDAAAYSWSTASFRAFQGAVIGASAALGLGAL